MFVCKNLFFSFLFFSFLFFSSLSFSVTEGGSWSWSEVCGARACVEGWMVRSKQ